MPAERPAQLIRLQTGEEPTDGQVVDHLRRRELPVTGGRALDDCLREPGGAGQPARRPSVQPGFEAGTALPKVRAQDFGEQRMQPVPG